MLNHVVRWSLEQAILHHGGRVVIASTHWTATHHNMVLVHVVE